MKKFKYLILWMFLISCSFASVNLNGESQLYQQKKEIVSKIVKSFSDNEIDDLVNPAYLPIDNKMISLKYKLENGDIGVKIQNNSLNNLNLVKYGIQIDGEICGINNTQIILPAKKQLEGYIFGAGVVENCIAKIQKKLKPLGTTNFIDVGKDFDMQKYNSLNKMIIMYPIHVAFIIKNSTQYLEYQETLYVALVKI